MLFLQRITVCFSFGITPKDMLYGRIRKDFPRDFDAFLDCHVDTLLCHSLAPAATGMQCHFCRESIIQRVGDLPVFGAEFVGPVAERRNMQFLAVLGDDDAAALGFGKILLLAIFFRVCGF